MCIVLLTTAHPDYALIVLDNRDEFILRPTSGLHWWSSSELSGKEEANGSADRAPSAHLPGAQQVLSSRDLQRAEQGTWLGVTKSGNFAVLTNYRETDTHDAAHPVRGVRSRGGMVTAWLGAEPSEPTSDFVQRMLENGGVKGVGGFSLICGKLRRQQADDDVKRIEPLAIISNRNNSADEVPWICGERGEVVGLSNTGFVDPPAWPKIKMGKRLTEEAVELALEEGMDKERLIQTLFAVLDHDTLPMDPDMSFEAYISVLKESIFIPPVGDEEHKRAMEKAAQINPKSSLDKANRALRSEERPDEACQGFETGMYGTQRQTIILVDWDGNVTYRERALWDANGIPVPRGDGDMTFRFKVEGWE